MSEAFSLAHEFTAKWEGGLSDHKDDPGGITNFGVSLRWLKQLEEENKREMKEIAQTADGNNALNPYDFTNDGLVDAEDIRACTHEQAAKLMREHFWAPLHCEKLPLPLATVLYDSAVNMGPVQAVRILQQSCNVVGSAHLDIFEELKVDGICGKKTIALARELQICGLDFYTARMAVRQRIQFYTSLAQNKPTFNAFLQGWKNRCQDLLEHLALLEREV